MCVNQTKGIDMAESTPDDGRESYDAREAVGVFETAEALEAAVDQLEISGFDRAAISVLASDAAVRDRLGGLYKSAADIEDDPKAPLAAFTSSDSMVGAESAAVGVPMYIGGMAGGLAAVASGGALALAFAAAVAGGAIGAGVGALLARVISERHLDHVREQLSQGGLVLWVNFSDDAAGARALAILIEGGARDAHLHEITRDWTLKDRPLALGQPDPFL
jgi:hypothetical protein